VDHEFIGAWSQDQGLTLTYAEVTLHSSVTTLDQGKYQLKEQDEVTSLAFYDLRTLFEEEESLAVIPQVQVTSDDLADNMSISVTNTPSLDEQMQEPQRRLAEKEAEIANLATRLENREREKNNEADSGNTVITP